MIKRLTLRHLEAFRAVMVRKSVTGAAELLDVTQPVVTRLISDFEERVAFPLFVRQKGRLIPTAEASLLLDEVQQALLSVDRVNVVSSSVRELKRGKLLVAAAPAIALCCLPEAIASFSEENRDTLISLHMENSPTVLEMTYDGRCDVGFAMLPTNATAGGSRELLLTGRMVAVVPKTHRLAGADVLRPEDFAGENFISMSRLIEARAVIDALFMAHDIERRINIETHISLAVIRHVEAGAGISIIDPVTAAGYRSELVKFIRFEPAVANDYCLVTSPKRKAPLIMQPFIEHVRRYIKQMVPPEWRMEE
jgi:DNA-binding transcriptional LysR family regulator